MNAVRHQANGMKGKERTFRVFQFTIVGSKY